MKRVIRASTFDEIINITAYFVPEGYSANDLAASTIVPIHNKRCQLDEQAMAQWNNFIDNVLATLDYYDFDVVDNHKSNHEGSASYYISFYPTNSKGKIISKYLINFRISDHFIPNLNKKSTGYYRKLAQNNSRTEGKQRWKLEALIVNDRTFESYDDALDYLDTTFSKLGHR